ncbi:MAG: hypothetical protein WDN06_12055 [Asticcacaulis sp.]
MAFYIGNSNSQTLTGGTTADVIDGRGGHDTLIGGGGNDIFAFTSRPVRQRHHFGLRRRPGPDRPVGAQNRRLHHPAALHERDPTARRPSASAMVNMAMPTPRPSP